MKTLQKCLQALCPLGSPKQYTAACYRFFTCPTHGNEEADIYCRDIPSIVIFLSSQSYIAGNRLFLLEFANKQAPATAI